MMTHLAEDARRRLAGWRITEAAIVVGTLLAKKVVTGAAARAALGAGSGAVGAGVLRHISGRLLVSRDRVASGLQNSIQAKTAARHGQAEVALLTPHGAPGVLYDPTNEKATALETN